MRTDVCLILEGTYPYVAGGVSTWVAQLLEYMPHLRFSILYIGDRRDTPRKPKYPIPPNVLELREVFVHDAPEHIPVHPSTPSLPPDAWAALDQFQRNLAGAKAIDLAPVCDAVKHFRQTAELFAAILKDPHAWQLVCQQYRECAPTDVPFLGYFWTHRLTTLPALNLLRAELPRARVYHTACTGYAGLLGAKAALSMNAPLLLTEHGIYTRERRIEIFNAEWIQESAEDPFMDLNGKESYFKAWWTHFFQSLARTAYAASDQITTLFEENRRSQIRDGADGSRTSIIPNGINTAELASLPRRERTLDEPLHVGFVGRISAIKDLRTLIKSLAILKGWGINFRGFLMGPMEEEAAYGRECLDLVQALGLSDLVTFPGMVKINEHLPNMDVIVLTSISEGLPFCILEANCAGVPVVATDVGACRELVFGRSAEDRALGASGFITPVASPTATANALRELARSPERARRLGDNGRRRVKQYFDIRDVMHQYQALYETYMHGGRRAWPA